MKSDFIIKGLITIILIVCYGVLAWFKAPWWQWLFCSFALIFLTFIWLPEIKSLSFSEKGAGLEKFEKKIDKALVEYEEFNKVIYPLFEITMATISIDSYIGVSVKTGELVDFLKRLKGLPSNFKNDPRVLKLTKAVVVETISNFSAELSWIRHENGIDDNAEDFILVKPAPLDSVNYFSENSVIINFDKLQESVNDFHEPFERERYRHKIDQLKQFYFNYYYKYLTK